MSKYSELEKHIIKVFNDCQNLTFEKVNYTNISACKPSARKGECKTDVYVALSNDNGTEKILKISVKKDDAEFLANKLKANDAESLLGPNWSSIIEKGICQIQNEFHEKKLFDLKRSKGKADIYFTLGWKLEVTNKKRTLSVPLTLSDEEIVNKVYKGTDQPSIRKNAYVNNNLVVNSGVADYLLESSVEKLSNINCILCSLVKLSTYIPPTTYLAFTANNYRLIADKADGPRSLAVAVKWQFIEGKIVPTLIFNEPLIYIGQNDLVPLVSHSLKNIGVDRKKYGDVSLDIQELFEEIKSTISM